MSEKTAAEICEAWMATRFEYWCEFQRREFGRVSREQYWWQSRFLDDLPSQWSPARQEAEAVIWREYIAPRLDVKLPPQQLRLREFPPKDAA